MLSRSQKAELVKNLNEQLSRAQAVFVTNLIGLKSNDAVALRKNVRDADGNIVITRNTLIQLAAKGTTSEEVLQKLKGTNAVAIAFSDAPAVAKALYDAGKEFEQVTLKKGMLEGKSLEKSEIEALAKLPSRDQMLGTLLATFNAPISAFARVLNALKDEVEGKGVETASQL